MMYEKQMSQRFSLRKYKFGLASVLLGMFFSVVEHPNGAQQVEAQESEHKYEVHHVTYDSLTQAQQSRIIREKVDNRNLVEGRYTLVYEDDNGAVYSNQDLPKTGQQTEDFYKLLLSGALLATGFLIIRKSKETKNLLVLTLAVSGLVYSATVVADFGLPIQEFVVAEQVTDKKIDGYRYIGYFVDAQDQPIVFQPVEELPTTGGTGGGNRQPIVTDVSETSIEASSEAPTETPTEAPTESPTESPTEAPTESPSEAPTEAPKDEQITQPTVTIDTVSDDDHLSIEEQSAATTTIKGQLSNIDEDVVDKKVTLHLGDKTYEATLGEDNSYTVDVPTEDLVAAQGVIKARVEVKDAAGNEASNTAEHTVTIEELQNLAGIVITDIGSDAQFHLADTQALVRLTGQLTLPGDLGKWQNHTRVRAVTVHIAGKAYTAQVTMDTDNPVKDFYIDISLDDLKAAQGQALTYTFETDSEIYSYNASNRTIAIVPSSQMEPLTASHIAFDASPYLTGGVGSYAINTLPADEVVIAGKVTGQVAAGDKVTVVVGQQRYETVTKEDLTFAVNVPLEVLSENNQAGVTAILKTQENLPLAEENIRDQAYYITPVSAARAKSDFVSKHARNDDALPYFIKSLMFPENKETGHLLKNNFGEGYEIKFHFVSTNELEGNERYYQAENFKESTKQVMRDALHAISDKTGLVFTETSKANADVNFYMDSIRVVSGGGDFVGYTFYGGHLHLDKYVYGAEGALTSTDKPNMYGVSVFLHEFMHSLGIKHPFFDTSSDGNHGGTVFLDRYEDRQVTTLMSYTSDKYFIGDDIKIFDLAALHYRYGVNKANRAGNDTYTFKKFNTASADGDTYIWDGDGVDTFDASKETAGVNLNLTPGSWIYRGQKTNRFVVDSATNWTANSYFNGQSIVYNDAQLFGDYMSRSMFYNFQRNDGQATGVADPKTTYTEGQAFIGYGTQIENAVGSDFDDVIVGNNADNNLFGGAGNDTLSGGAGHDHLDGGQGADRLVGGSGDDTYIVDDAGDEVVEAANEGTDTVYSSVAYQLPANVENLTLIGKATQGTGNDLDNILRGNSQDNTLDGGAGNDRLHGGAGQNTLTGGAGQDTFVFDTSVADMLTTITDFTVGQDKIELSSQVFTKLQSDLSNFAEVMQYDSGTGELKYKATNEFVTFAKLTPGLGLSASDFVVKDSQLPAMLVVQPDPAIQIPETSAPATVVTPSTIAQLDDFSRPVEQFPSEGLQGFGQEASSAATSEASAHLDAPMMVEEVTEVTEETVDVTSVSASQNDEADVILPEAPGDLSRHGGFCPCCGGRKAKQAEKFSVSDQQLTSFAGRLLEASTAVEHQPRVISTQATETP